MISRILLRAQKYPVKTINTQKGFGELIANRIEKVINGHEKK
jgi:hypothetical protein